MASNELPVGNVVPWLFWLFNFAFAAP